MGETATKTATLLGQIAAAPPHTDRNTTQWNATTAQQQQQRPSSSWYGVNTFMIPYRGGNESHERKPLGQKTGLGCLTSPTARPVDISGNVICVFTWS
ncbi:MAG: hypothetical protein M1837_005288 [Sclerophora amabilis]|nr:MAG: hypothetical protein M1837_005288 [Sclerophora amabilis]